MRKITQTVSGLRLLKTVENAADIDLLTIKTESMKLGVDDTSPQVQKNIQPQFMICKNASKQSSNLLFGLVPKPAIFD